MKTLKRYGLMLIIAACIAPLAVHSIGCEGDVDDDEASFEIGE